MESVKEKHSIKIKGIVRSSVKEERGNIKRKRGQGLGLQEW